jgi:hypothetical protein
MRFLRERLAVLALGLLLMQVSAAAVSGWFACCDSKAQSSATPMDCCKEGVTAPGKMCPMHQAEADQHHGVKRCAMRNGCSPDRTFLLTLFVDAGIPSHASALALEHVAAPSIALAASPVGRGVVPEPPPPRF